MPVVPGLIGPAAVADAVPTDCPEAFGAGAAQIIGVMAEEPVTVRPHPAGAASEPEAIVAAAAAEEYAG